MSDDLLNVNNLRARLAHEAHVWFCRPGEISAAETLAGYRAILSPQELERQQRFYFARDQHGYLVSHALVRIVLSKYGDVQPQDWAFEVGQHGKPEIVAAVNKLSLRFNLSHADGLTACVVTAGLDCGVDVESRARQCSYQQIAERMFALPELEVIRKADGDMARQRFFEFWTLREAYVKALGTGLAGFSRQFHFRVADGEAELANVEMRFTNQRVDAGHWQLALLNMLPSHVVAVALHKGGDADKKIVAQYLQP